MPILTTEFINLQFSTVIICNPSLSLVPQDEIYACRVISSVSSHFHLHKEGKNTESKDRVEQENYSTVQQNRKLASAVRLQQNEQT
jgi:hypothetical protein